MHPVMPLGVGDLGFKARLATESLRPPLLLKLEGSTCYAAMHPVMHQVMPVGVGVGAGVELA